MSLITVSIGVLSTVAGVLFAAEFEAWAPRVSQRLTERAVRRLPLDLRERLGEEWASFLADTPGYVGKLWCAVGFYLASGRITRERLWPILAKVLLWMAAHPRQTWLVFSMWRNWGNAIGRVRAMGYSVPHTAYELSLRDFVKKYGKSTNAQLELQAQSTEFFEWVESNRVPFLIALCFAAKKESVEEFLSAATGKKIPTPPHRKSD